MKIRNIVAAFAVMVIPSMLSAQNEKSSLPTGKKSPTIVVPGNSVQVGYAGGMSLFPVLSNAKYTLTPSWAEGETPWFVISQRNAGSWKIKSDYWFRNEPRTGKLVFNLADGSKKEVTVIQSANHASDIFTGDIKVKVKSANASSQNSESESINKTFDGNYQTFYHSQWSSGKTQFPVDLTYTFSDAPHIDYINYVPRIGNENGRMGKVTISYSTVGEPNKYIDIVKEYDCGFSADATTVKLGDNGVDDVKNIRFKVHTGKNNFVACAEMEFYSYNEDEKKGFSDIFTNDLCYELKKGVTKEQLDTVSNPFARQLGYYLLSGEYDTKFRVGEFEAYENLSTLAARLKTTQYNKYENPTGIYFEKDAKNVIFAEGISDKYPVQLIIKNFGQGEEESSYALKNGVNIIESRNRGNGYVSYYTNDYKVAPKVKLHFAMGKVNGYFDLERGDTNEDWEKMLANACSDIMDMRTKRIQVAFPTQRFRENCPKNARELALNIDSTIYYERDVMGLSKFGIEPKNRQFARVVWGGFMHADGIGAAANDNSVSVWMKPNRSEFEFWGFGHELGHVNQVRPGLKWVGCGETTNNIYSAWVQFKLGTGWYRLESENTGLNIFSGLKGGRFNCYLEEGVRKGNSWQLQVGPDYGGVPPKDKETVTDEDYLGHKGGKVTVTCGNYDHFVKLVPLWQLQLYCTQAGFSPDVYGKVMQAIRTTNEKGMTNGQLQLKFIREVCDSTGIDFLPFFEKAGMLKPIKAFIADYSKEWLIINDKMINDLKAYVKNKGHKKLEAEVNYISALNWKTYKDKAPLEGTLNVGCTLTNHRGTPFVKINHHSWKNTVAFETYDAEGKLLRISMHGLGGDNGDNYTMAMFPSGSAYIVAVGWDGTRMKCYAK